ncbi:synaptosomal-associated protein 25 isoform X2 [Hydra vulgaris]|uniref:Synaptosomal-associated protein 25 isoform X2 n=1 Tax=Hydra vulgaris TaxID=6087 RepID=A0ABM4C4F6_HYDVU
MLSEEEQMRMELQRMQRKADEVTNESLESTRRMLLLAEETQDTGIKTLVALDEQGEKLNRIEENLDDINAGMKEAEKNLTGLEKFCGLCVCSCRKRGDFETSEVYRKAYTRKEPPNSAGIALQTKDKVPNHGAATSGYISRITNDAREDEMDENIGQVAGILTNLKSMAIDMGGELDRQNTQITRLTDKASANESRIENANKRANQILRN